MPSKEPRIISVVTIPLKTEKWQEDRIDKRMEMCKDIYNSLLAKKLKQLGKIESDPDYKNALEIIATPYKCEDKKKISEIKKSEEYKKAIQFTRDMLNEANFNEFGIMKEAMAESKYYSENMSATIAARTIGKPMWAAFKAYLYGDGDTIHFKKKGGINILAADGRTGLRIANSKGRGVHKRRENEPLYCMSGTKGQVMLKMPLIIDPQDTYLNDMLKREYGQIILCRRKIRGKYKYFIQICVQGPPMEKLDEDGNPLHPISPDPIGVFIGTRFITVTSADGTKTIDLKNDVQNEDEIAALMTYMDNSRRAHNPDNYNEDGTIKNGPLHWNYSKGYYRAKNKFADLKRKEAERRKIRSYEIANEILAMGSKIVVNNFSFKGASMRTREDEFDESANQKTSRKRGKDIAENAPSQILTIIDNKLTASGLEKMIRITVYIDYDLDNYRELYSRMLYERAKEL